MLSRQSRLAHVQHVDQKTKMPVASLQTKDKSPAQAVAFDLIDCVNTSEAARLCDTDENPPQPYRRDEGTRTNNAISYRDIRFIHRASHRAV